MASTLPSHTLRRASIPTQLPSSTRQQVRNASLLRRPHRPYTFTQLVTLSDGSTYMTRSTSPQPIFRSTKDTRNSPLWQPSLLALRNQEQDEAGRLRAFRDRFGRGWDLDAAEAEEGADAEGKQAESAQDSLMDLISGGYNATPVEEAETGATTEAEEVEMVMVRRDGVLVKVPKKDEKAKGASKKGGLGA